MKKIKSDPMRTKTGKPRLGPLNVNQLTELMKSARPKNRSKIQRRIDTLVKVHGQKLPVADLS